MSETGLGPVIAAALRGLHERNTELVSNTIRAAFSVSEMSDAQRARIAAAISPLRDADLAVRSSAVTEDLPDASFAGQQDTYLNVPHDQVFRRIIDCWASLWTARSIDYRLRHGIGSHDLALAVVIQSMVDADASGVLFTANPLTGHRGQRVVESVSGLEQTRIGAVTPDRFIVESGEIIPGEQANSLDHRSSRARPGDLGSRIETA